MPDWPIRVLLVAATVATVSAAAGLANAAPVTLPVNPVHLDDAGHLLVNETISGVVLWKVGDSHSLTLKPKVHYNSDATLTLYNDPQNDGPDGPSSFNYVGLVVQPLTTPFVADPQVRDNAPGDPDRLDYTATDGLLAWRVAASSSTTGPDPVAADASLDESGPFPGPAGDRRVVLCVSPTVPRLVGCVADTDRDGYWTHQELLAGSDPTDATSGPGSSALATRTAALQAFACARAAASAPLPPCGLVPGVP